MALTEEQSRMAAEAYPGVARYTWPLCRIGGRDADELAGVVGLAVCEAAMKWGTTPWRGDFLAFAQMVATRRIRDEIDRLKRRSPERSGRATEAASVDRGPELVDARDAAEALCRRARLTPWQRWAVLRERGDTGPDRLLQRAAWDAKREAIRKLRRSARAMKLLEVA